MWSLFSFGSSDHRVSCTRRTREDGASFVPGTIDEHHIVRPSYAPGRELLMYRDIDVLHSSPDVAYRTSVMRFM
jgi:hypothetical protein